jgi:hypothetical protein
MLMVPQVLLVNIRDMSRLGPFSLLADAANVFAYCVVFSFDYAKVTRGPQAPPSLLSHPSAPSSPLTTTTITTPPVNTTAPRPPFIPTRSMAAINRRARGAD